MVVDELQFDAPATKEMASVLKALGLGQTSTLVATDAHDVNVYKSARNIARVTISPVSDLNALVRAGAPADAGHAQGAGRDPASGRPAADATEDRAE